LGYFGSSAAAPPIVSIKTAAVATAAVELRSNMIVLPAYPNDLIDGDEAQGAD
jgi:hypothetical protein